MKPRTSRLAESRELDSDESTRGLTGGGITNGVFPAAAAAPSSALASSSGADNCSLGWSSSAYPSLHSVSVRLFPSATISSMWKTIEFSLTTSRSCNNHNMRLTRSTRSIQTSASKYVFYAYVINCLALKQKHSESKDLRQTPA